MNNLSILLKNSLNNLIGSIMGKKKRRFANKPILLGALAFVVFLTLSFFQAFSQFAGMAPMGLSKLALFNGFLITFLILVLYVSMKVTATPKTNDTDLLLSLPIKKHLVALSKVLTRYFFDLLISFLLLSPYLILYVIYEGFSLPFLLIGFSFILFIPLLSVGLNYILEFVITRLFNKTKHASLLKSLIALVVFFATMTLFFLTMPNFASINPADADAFIYSFPPISWFLKFLLTQDIVSLLLSLCITVPPFVLGVFLYSKNFGRSFGVYQNRSKELLFLNNTSVLKSLIKKELNRYFLTPIYVLNTIIGPILIVGFSIFIAFKGSAGIIDMIGIPIPEEIIFALITIAICSSISLTMISASALSLEGRNLWILKSTPAKESDIFISKAFPNIILTAPVAFVCLLALSFILNFSFVQAILAILICVTMSLNVSFGGLFINLLIPKLDWAEETQVVKQSISVLISMLFNFVLVALPIILYVIMPTLSIMFLAALTLLAYSIILIIICLALFTKGKKIFQKLQ